MNEQLLGISRVANFNCKRILATEGDGHFWGCVLMCYVLRVHLGRVSRLAIDVPSLR